MEKRYCIKWNGDLLYNDVTNFIHSGMLHDVSLVSDDGTVFSANRMVLLVTSEYFRKVFSQLKGPGSGKEVTIVLKDITARTLELLLEFVVKGTVIVEQSQVRAFIEAAMSLKIRGLAAPSKDGGEQKHTDAGGGAVVTNVGRKRQSSEESAQSSRNSQGFKQKRSSPGNQIVPREKKPDEMDHFDVQDNPVFTPEDRLARGRECRDPLENVRPNHKDAVNKSQTDVADMSVEGEGPGAHGMSHDGSHQEEKTEMENNIVLFQNYENLDDSDVQFIKFRPGRQNLQKYKNYTEDQIRQAIDDISTGKLKCCAASKKYGIPSRTLYARMKKLLTPNSTPCKFKSGECDDNKNVTHEELEIDCFPPSPIPLTPSQRMQIRGKEYYERENNHMRLNTSTPLNSSCGRLFNDPKDEMPSPIASIKSSDRLSQADILGI